MLSRLTRARLLEIGRESLPAESFDPIQAGKLKKALLVEALAKAFARLRERRGRSPWIPAVIAGEDE